MITGRDYHTESACCGGGRVLKYWGLIGLEPTLLASDWFTAQAQTWGFAGNMMGGLGTRVIMTWVTVATTGSDDRRLVWEDIMSTPIM